MLISKLEENDLNVDYLFNNLIPSDFRNIYLKNLKSDSNESLSLFLKKSLRVMKGLDSISGLGNMYYRNHFIEDGYELELFEEVNAFNKEILNL